MVAGRITCLTCGNGRRGLRLVLKRQGRSRASLGDGRMIGVIQLVFDLVIVCLKWVVLPEVELRAGTKVLRATIWVMGGMLRRAAQAYLEMGGWTEKKRVHHQCGISENTVKGLFQKNPVPQNTREQGIG